MQGGWSKGMSLCMVGGPRGLSLCKVGGPRGLVCTWWVVQGAESVQGGWSKG